MFWWDCFNLLLSSQINRLLLFNYLKIQDDKTSLTSWIWTYLIRYICNELFLRRTVYLRNLMLIQQRSIREWERWYSVRNTGQRPWNYRLFWSLFFKWHWHLNQINQSSHISMSITSGFSIKQSHFSYCHYFCSWFQIWLSSFANGGIRYIICFW